MRRSRAALVVGLLVVLVAFGYGVEKQTSATVAGERIGCGAPISASWLVSGTDYPSIAGPGTTEERAATAACDTVVRRARIGVLSTMTAGALLALVGWTAMREGGRRTRTPTSEAQPSSTTP
jgi:hypothetical protein